MFFVVLCCASYRPANVFLRDRATQADIRTSIDIMDSQLVNKTAGVYVRRVDVVQGASDDILFDSMVGSRQGRVPVRDAQTMLHLYRADFRAFERRLLCAQASVLSAQLLYLCFQFAGILTVCRVLYDLCVNTESS